MAANTNKLFCVQHRETWLECVSISPYYASSSIYISFAYKDQQHNGVRCGNIRLWSLNTDGSTLEVYHCDFCVRVYILCECIRD